MELDRFYVFLSALCVVFAAETTLDMAFTTSVTYLSADTEVTEQLATTTLRSEKETSPTADTPLDNEIEVEERATSAATRTTEETPKVKDLPTTKLESTTVESKDILGDSDVTTTTASPPPVHVTERSSVTKEAAEPTSQEPITAPPSRGAGVTTTPSEVSQRPIKLKQKKNKTRPKPATTTVSTPTLQETKKEISQQSPAASSIHQVTAKPDRKSSVEVKKGTINVGGLQKYKKRKPSKKDNGMSSLVYIPLMIQAQMIPMMLFQLKFFALKALAIGKLALIILGLNLLRNAIIGYHNDEQQYEQESLASAHYGYNGGPEYGSWVNRRMDRVGPAFASHKFIPDRELRRNNENRFTNDEYESIRPQRRHSNNPYRGYETHLLKKIR